MKILFRNDDRRAETSAVDELVLPRATRHELLRHHPHLTDEGTELAAAGLRQWYAVVRLAAGQPAAMPSRVVDDLWHAHIACTRDYAAFCRRAFGRFLHHDPESTMDAAAVARNAGQDLRRTHDLCLRIERPAGLPLLFRLDAELDVEGARHYVTTCGSGPCSAGPETCVGHLPRVARGRSRTWQTGWGGSSAGGCGGGTASVRNGGGSDGGGSDGGASEGGGGGCGGGGCGGS